MAWTICTDSFEFSNGTIGTPVPFPTSYMSAGSLQRVDFVSGGSSPFVVEKPTIGEWKIGPDAEGSYFSINVTGYGDGSWGHVTIEGNITFWHEPSRRSMFASLGFNGEDGLKLGVGLYYDEDNEKAGFIKFEGDSRGYVEATTSDPGYPNTSKYFYNFLKNNIYVPSVTSILDYQAQNSHYHRRYATENSILYNNTDSSKYVTYTYSGTTYKIYNSAIYYDQTNNAVYFMLLLNEYGEMLSQYENSPNEWRTGSRSYLHNSTNGVYYGNFYYNNAGFIYYNGVSSSTLASINSYGLPFFTDKDKYMDYICNVYVPITIKVSYIIPDDEYTYCNLTWKKDYEPEDKNDGYTTTLLKDESVINVTGLEENSKYVFKIFTSKSESPPFIYECGIRKKVKLSDLIPDDINTRHVETFTTTSSAWDSAYQYANNNPNDLVIYRHSSGHPDNRYDKETNSYDIQDIQEWSDYFIFYPLKYPITVYGGEQKITFNPNSHYHAYDWGGIAVVVFDYSNDIEESTGSASCYNGATDQFSVGETRTIKTTLNEPVYTKHVVFRSNYGNWTINDIYLTIKG